MANDHQVPQFYLRNFEIESPSYPIPCRHIYVYKSNTQPTYKAIKSVACEDNYYTINDVPYKESADNNHFIHTVSENFASKVVAKIIKDKRLNLSQDDKGSLTFFVATLVTRNPLVHDFFKIQIIEESKNKYKLLAQNKSKFQTLVEEINNKDKLNLSEEEIEELRISFLNPGDNYKFNILENNHNKNYIRSLLTSPHTMILFRRLFCYHFHLLIIESEKFFVTSDNPVVFLPPILPDLFGLSQCPVFLPISPKLALFINPMFLGKKELIIKDKLVDSYLKKSILFAKNTVFSHLKSNEIQNIVNKTEQKILQLNYQHNFLTKTKLNFLIEKGIIKI